MIGLALLLQAATSASAAPPPRFSILYNPCVPGASRDVIVCGKDGSTSDRLPLPDDAPPTPDYVKPDSRDYRDNAMNLDAPCAARQSGCQVGFGPPIAPLVAAGVKALSSASKDSKWARAKARDGDRRQPIDLDAAAPAGRLEP